MSFPLNPGQIATPEAPWLGLRSFTEEAHDYFFGRGAELEDLYERVLDKPLTILFGPSGLGKSSLLQAALIPRLRAQGFLPVLVRFDHEPEAAPLEKQMLENLREALASGGFGTQLDKLSAALGDEGAKPQWDAAALLWLIFHDPSYGFLSLRGESTDPSPRPVFLIDQFEEIFTLGERPTRRAVSLTFREALSALVENRPPSSLRVQLEKDDALVERIVYQAQHAHVLLSLREDFLHMLERWRRSMPSLMENRFELRMLSGPQAFEAVVRPGQLRSGEPPIIPDEVGQAIVRFVAGAEDDVPLAEIDAVPPLLSLVCAELNAQRIAAGEQQITRAQFEGQSDEILQSFYLRSFHLASYGGTLDDIPDAAIALEALKCLIEDRLLSPDGYRESIAFDTMSRDLSKSVAPTAAKAVLDEVVGRRLLTVEERGGVRRLELAHDVLAPIVKASRDERQEKEALANARREQERAKAETERILLERNRFRRVAFLACCLAIIAVLGVIVSYSSLRKANEATSSAVQAKEKEATANRTAQTGFESAWTAFAELYEKYCRSMIGQVTGVTPGAREQIRSKLRARLLQQCRELHKANPEHRGVQLLIARMMLDEGKSATTNEDYRHAEEQLTEAEKWVDMNGRIASQPTLEEAEVRAEVLMEHARLYSYRGLKEEGAALGRDHLATIRALASSFPRSWRLAYLCIRLENIVNSCLSNDASTYQILSDRLQSLLPDSDNDFDPVIWRFILSYNAIFDALGDDSAPISASTDLIAYYRQNIFLPGPRFSPEEQVEAVSHFASFVERLKPYLMHYAKKDEAAARRVIEDVSSLARDIENRSATQGTLASTEALIAELNLATLPPGTDPKIVKDLQAFFEKKQSEAKAKKRDAGPISSRIVELFASYSASNTSEPEKAEIIRSISAFAKDAFLAQDLAGKDRILGSLVSIVVDLEKKDSKDALLVIHRQMVDECITAFNAASTDKKAAVYENFTNYTTPRLKALYANGDYSSVVSFWNAAYSNMPVDPIKDNSSYIEQAEKYIGSLLRLHEQGKAGDALKQTLELADAVLAKKPWDWYVRESMRTACFLIANIYSEIGEHQKAQDLLRRAYTDRKTYFGYTIDLEKYKELPSEGVVPKGASKEDAAFFGAKTKMFVVPCDVNGSKVPVQFYVASGNRGYDGLTDQFRWIKEYRGVEVPADVAESFKKLHEIAVENKVNFLDLCVYALNYPRDEKKLPDPPRLASKLNEVDVARKAYKTQSSDTNRLALAGKLGGAAFAAIFEKQYADAVTWSHEALKLIADAGQGADPKQKAELVFVYGNLAHALLFQGKYAEALAIYEEHWEKPLQNRKFKDAILEDFAMFAQAGLTHPDLARVKGRFGVDEKALAGQEEANRVLVTVTSDETALREPTQEQLAELGDEEIVALLSGKNKDGQDIYNYLKLKFRNYFSMRKAIQSGGKFNIKDYGEVVEAGMGTPSIEVKTRMEKQYKMIRFPKK